MKTSIVLHTQNTNADLLLDLLRSSIALDKLPVPELVAPDMPNGYADVKSGLSLMAERSADPARSEARRTSHEDVAQELLALLNEAHRKGFKFADLPATLDYDQALALHRSSQTQYARSADAKAGALALAVQEWIDDLAAVLKLKAVLGIEVLTEAGEAPNKTMAATALDLMVRDKLTSSGAVGLPILAAGRGLMQLRSAALPVDELTLEDLELVVASAGLAIIPAAMPGYGLASSDLDFRVLGSLVKVNQRSAVLYRNAQTAQGSAMLPLKALAATSAKALQEVQQSLTERLDSTPHHFGGDEAVSSLAEARRRASSI